MAAIVTFVKGNVRIGSDLFARVRDDSDERVIGSVQDQAGDRNPVYDTRCGGSLVVVGSAREAAVIRRYPIVELTQ